MGIKKYAAISMVLLIFAFFTAAVNAEELKAYYLVQGNYDKEKQTYTVDVYLDTQVYLAAGTFGMELGENVPVTWNSDTENGKNVGYMQIDTDNFELLETKPFKDNENTFRTNRQIVVQWGLNKTDISEPIKLGSFTINNVTLNDENKPAGWTDPPFRLLDWGTTNLAETKDFKYIDESDGYGKSLNDEIWRSTTEAEKAAGASAGYYQGCAYDNGEEWIDIGFKFTSNLNNEIKIIGTVYAYNPKNDIEVTAFGTDGAYTGEIKERIIYPDGRITYTYEIPVKETGDYTLVIQKSAHLTYSAQTTVPENTDEHSAGEVTLICGDINGDGYIKYPDRAELIRFLNRQKAWTENVTKFNKSDLNGDGLVNLFDLNILKSNLDKTYTILEVL